VCLCICEELGHERHVGDVHVLLAPWEYICTEFVQVQGHLPHFSCHKRHGSVNFFPWVPCSRWSLCLQVRVASPFPSHRCALSRAARAKLLWVVTTPTNLSPRRGQASSGKYWSVLCLFHIPYRSVKLTELFSLTLMSCLGRNRGMSPWSGVVGSSTANHTTHVFPNQPRASIVIYVSQWYSPRLWFELYHRGASGSGLPRRCFTGVVASEGRCLARAAKGCSLLLLVMGTCSNGRWAQRVSPTAVVGARSAE
jgi:hypothetical protein